MHSLCRAFVVGPLKQRQVTARGGRVTCVLGPWAAVLARPLQQREVPT